MRDREGEKKKKRVWEEARETEQAESRRPKVASAHEMRKWSGSQEARPPNLSLCRRTPHYCTSWALGVAFEVLWGTSSHETSIVNPLVNQVCSWAYVWSGSFSSEDSKRSKEKIVAGWKETRYRKFQTKSVCSRVKTGTISRICCAILLCNKPRLLDGCCGRIFFKSNHNRESISTMLNESFAYFLCPLYLR